MSSVKQTFPLAVLILALCLVRLDRSSELVTKVMLFPESTIELCSCDALALAIV